MRCPGLLLPLLLLSAAPAWASAPLQVTTDSLEYCNSLAARLARHRNGTEEPARGLGQEGIRLCRAGHIRSGIAKLRRALRATQGAD